MSRRFGDLRSAIARRSFSDTCAAIERWPEDDPELHELALPYAHEHLSSWPGLRHAPGRWCDAICAGERPPWRSLANAYAYRSRTFQDGRRRPYDEPSTSLSSVLSAHDESLRALSLGGSRLSEESWSALTHALHLGRLSELDIGGCPLLVSGLRLLGRAPFVRSLEGLKLSGLVRSMIESSDMEAFLGSGDLVRLQTLDVTSLPLQGGAVLPALRVLRLFVCRTNARFMGEACGEPLESFSFGGDHEFDLSMAERFAGSFTPSLRVLEITNGIQRAATVDALLGGRHVRNVESLDLSGAAYVMSGGSSDLAAAVCGVCRKLKRLVLASCQLGDDAVDALAGSACASTLTHLDLSKNAIGERSLQTLVSGAFPALKSIDLSVTGVRGLSTLHAGLRRGALPKLEVVSIEAGQIEGGCTLHDAIAAMREVGVKLDPGVGFMRPRRSNPS